jgi:glycosyltransferase involved in cell wall biosynthesis
MKVIMFVSNPFTHDVRVYNEAQTLIRSGYEVTVIARDTGRESSPRQTWDGIEVVRLRTKLPIKYGLASWLWNGLNLVLWQRQARREVLALNKEEHFDAINCHNLDTLAIGTGLKRKLGIPLIYDAHEMYAYMRMPNVPGWMVKALLWLEKRLVRKVDRIINVCEPQRRYFETITDKPITIIMNCKPLQGLEYQPPDNEKFTVLYVGSLGPGRVVPMLVQAAKEVPGVRCLIGGIGQPAYVEALQQECARTSNVIFVGRVPIGEVIPMTGKADCVFFMADPADLNNRIALANKQFEAMVCGRPIICTKGTYSGEITEQEDVGLVVECSEQALREAIIKLRDDPQLRERLGKNALKAAIARYNWPKEEAKLLELYRGL